MVIWHGASPLHTDGSSVFASLHQCPPPFNKCFFRPMHPSTTMQMASRSVQSILHSSRYRVSSGRPRHVLSPKIALSYRDLNPYLCMVPWANRVHYPNVIGSAVFHTFRQSTVGCPSPSNWPFPCGIWHLDHNLYSWAITAERSYTLQ